MIICLIIFSLLQSPALPKGFTSSFDKFTGNTQVFSPVIDLKNRSGMNFTCEHAGKEIQAKPARCFLIIRFARTSAAGDSLPLVETRSKFVFLVDGVKHQATAAQRQDRAVMFVQLPAEVMAAMPTAKEFDGAIEQYSLGLDSKQWAKAQEHWRLMVK
jgi:hypothetical protein